MRKVNNYRAPLWSCFSGIAQGSPSQKARPNRIAGAGLVGFVVDDAVFSVKPLNGGPQKGASRPFGIFRRRGQFTARDVAALITQGLG